MNPFEDIHHWEVIITSALAAATVFFGVSIVVLGTVLGLTREHAPAHKPVVAREPVPVGATPALVPA
ncbi:MAG: hypothetical protein U0792_23745 [Gemmataceae bacterium]